MSKNAARTSKKAARTTGATKPKSAAKPAKPRAESKQAQLITMLKQPDGATIVEITKALDWLPHTVRGAIAGALKKKLGLKVESEKFDNRGRVYRIAE